MPYMTNGKRNYSAELAWEKRNGKKRQNARVQRNAARAEMTKKVGSTALKGKDVGHKKAISRGGKNGLANLFVQNPTNNRSFARNKDGSMKSERSKRGK